MKDLAFPQLTRTCSFLKMIFNLLGIQFEFNSSLNRQMCEHYSEQKQILCQFLIIL